jgi:hypothetical protein
MGHCLACYSAAALTGIALAGAMRLGRPYSPAADY